jgi:hypothetical protein
MAATGTVPLAWVDHWCAEQGERVYLRQPRNGHYHEISWLEFRRQALQMAASSTLAAPAAMSARFSL